MRSIVVAAALSCVCIPGAPVVEAPVAAFPVSNADTKSSRLAPHDGSLRISRSFDQLSTGAIKLAAADPHPKIMSLAAIEIVPPSIMSPEVETTGSIPATSVEIERQIDSMVELRPIHGDPDLAPPISKDALCDRLADAAQDTGLPLLFFNNLIWQESRFKTRAVSPAGAQGVAQFMPYVAASFGVSNPFDPFQALPASARLLQKLHEQFGNLGLAAAAYNAGPKRVVDWLSKRTTLPAETRHYVKTITGRAAEHWRTRARAQSAAFRMPPQAPCAHKPTFAEAEEAARKAEEALKLAEAEKARQRRAKLAAKTPKTDRKAAEKKTGSPAPTAPAVAPTKFRTADLTP